MFKEALSLSRFFNFFVVVVVVVRPVMNAREIPIKLPIHEDDETTTRKTQTTRINKSALERRRREEYRFLLLFLSFFLSFFEFRSVKGRRGSAKSDDERNNLRLRRLSLSRVYFLSLLWSRGGNGKGSSTGESSLVFDRCIPRTTLIVVVTAKRVSFVLTKRTNTQILN